MAGPADLGHPGDPTDCDAENLDAVRSVQYGAGNVFYGIWHVRVAKAGTYQFAATSTDPDEDNVLNVHHLDSHTAATATLTESGYDDDSGPGLNALLSVSLTAGQDYFLRVAGWADGLTPPFTGTGPYTATFTGP